MTVGEDCELQHGWRRRLATLTSSPTFISSSWRAGNMTAALISFLSFCHMQLGWNFNMLVSKLGGVNCLWPFMVISQIYGNSNFSHNFWQLALMGKFMTKIWVAINLTQDHKWSIPLASLLHTVHLGLSRHLVVPTLPRYNQWKMEDDHTYHKMKVHDNTNHHMV